MIWGSNFWRKGYFEVGDSTTNNRLFALGSFWGVSNLTPPPDLQIKWHLRWPDFNLLKVVNSACVFWWKSMLVNVFEENMISEPQVLAWRWNNGRMLPTALPFAQVGEDCSFVNFPDVPAIIKRYCIAMLLLCMRICISTHVYTNMIWPLLLFSHISRCMYIFPTLPFT